MPELNQIQYNGTKYDIADEVSRNELDSVKSAFSDLTIPVSSVLVNYGLKGTNGEFAPNNKYSINFLKVYNIIGAKLDVRLRTADMYGYCFFDNDFSRISGENVSASTLRTISVTVPQNAYYLAATNLSSEQSNFLVKIAEGFVTAVNAQNAVFRSTKDTVDIIDALTKTTETVTQDDLTYSNGYLDGLTRNISVHSGDTYRHTDLMKILPGSDVTYNFTIASNNKQWGIVFFDAGKKPIWDSSIRDSSESSTLLVEISGTVAAPSDAEYIQLSFRAPSGNLYPCSFSFTHVKYSISGESPSPSSITRPVASVLSKKDLTFNHTGFINRNTGEVESNQYYSYSNAIQVNPGDIVFYNLNYITNSAIIACYSSAQNQNSGTYVKDKSLYSNTADGNIETRKGTFIVPAGIYSIKFSCRTADGKTTLYEWSVVRFSDTDVVQYLSDRNAEGLQWQGKHWVAFGTSLTDTRFINVETNEIVGKYAPILANLAGLELDNEGIAGGTIGGSTHKILTKILSYDFTGVDLITLEGFVNDFASQVPLGDIDDTTYDTFYGALYQAVNYCQQNSNATIVLIGDPTGRRYTFQNDPALIGRTVDYSYNVSKVIDGETVYQSTYTDAMRKFAHHAGCYYIDAGAESGINCNNPQYYQDHLHPNALGGEQYAMAIWEHLKNIPCKIVSE